MILLRTGQNHRPVHMRRRVRPVQPVTGCDPLASLVLTRTAKPSLDRLSVGVIGDRFCVRVTTDKTDSKGRTDGRTTIAKEREMEGPLRRGRQRRHLIHLVVVVVTGFPNLGAQVVQFHQTSRAISAPLISSVVNTDRVHTQSLGLDIIYQLRLRACPSIWTRRD